MRSAVPELRTSGPAIAGNRTTNGVLQNEQVLGQVFSFLDVLSTVRASLVSLLWRRVASEAVSKVERVVVKNIGVRALCHGAPLTKRWVLCTFS